MEPPAPGGWEAAIDASLAARLLRPAVRAGISDPAHGRRLAARLQRTTAPSLADDVARRYGAAVMDPSRPPIVHAVPLAREAPATMSADAAAHLEGSEGKADAARPTVRPTERTMGPIFPPLRPTVAAPVQRVADAALPVAIARRVSSEGAGVTRRIAPEPPGAPGPRIAEPIGWPSGPRGGEVSSSRPVVAPAPTRLQRQLAADRADAVALASPTLPLVHATRPSPGGVSIISGTRASDGAYGADGRMTHPIASRGSGGAARPAAAGSAGAASANVVQRVTGPAAPPLIVPVRGMTSASTPPVVAAAPPGSAHDAGDTLPSVRSAAVVAPRAADAGAMPAVRARPVPAAPEGLRVAGEGSIRPVVAGAVQRVARPGIGGAADGGAGARLVHAAPLQARAQSAGAARRQAASATPPPGAPPAELPTLVAPDARPARGADTARLAEEVYELLVQRLERERKQRGW